MNALLQNDVSFELKKPWDIKHNTLKLIRTYWPQSKLTPSIRLRSSRAFVYISVSCYEWLGRYRLLSDLCFMLINR
jgi:hypothetical protein